MAERLLYVHITYFINNLKSGFRPKLQTLYHVGRKKQGGESIKSKVLKVYKVTDDDEPAADHEKVRRGLNRLPTLFKTSLKIFKVQLSIPAYRGQVQ
jgi:hypothetical protein